MSDDLPQEQVSQELQRVLTSELFRKAQRQRRLLEYVMGCLESGNFDQTREYVIAVDVFNRRSSFDQRLDPIVRVEASRLRAKLARYYETEGKDSPIIIELPRGTYLPTVRRRPDAAAGEAQPAQVEQTQPEPADAVVSSDAVPAPPPSNAGRWPLGLKVLAAGSALSLVVSAALAAWHFRTHEGGIREPVRVTSESGLAAHPALSPDGKLLAYSSDRSGKGNLSIWVQTLSTGRAVQLTHHASDDREPSFSPDGSEIAFRSEKDGGGIYTVSVFGEGKLRQIARNGHRPRYSPDGASILYWTRDEGWGPGQIHVVPARGGTPRRLAAELRDVHHPVWSPDGRHILVCGALATQTGGGDHDWWVIPTDGAPPQPTGAASVLVQIPGRRSRRSFRDLPNPAEWTDRGIVFSARRRDGESLYLATFQDGALSIDPHLQPLTMSAGFDVQPAAAGSRIAFLNASMSCSIYSLSMDAAGHPGTLTKVTSNLFDSQPSLSADGRRMAFVSDRADGHDVWLKDLASGTESPLTTAGGSQRSSVISADGTKVAYVAQEMSGHVLYVAATKGGEPEKICQDCGRPTDWSHDGRYILLEARGAAPPLAAMDLTSGKRFDAVSDADAGIRWGSFSPDGRWVAFYTRKSGNPPQIYIAPFRGGKTVSRQDWVEVGAGYTPAWSQDGRSLYFLSDRDGFRCIWVRRLRPENVHPEGDSMAVQHFHGGGHSLLVNVRESPHDVGLSVSKDKLVFAMDQVVGNIWMVER